MAETMPDNRYTEPQHLALLESAVSRETADLKAAKEELETQIASLTTTSADLKSKLVEAETKIGVLEAEKAAAEATAAAAAQEFNDYKAEQERTAQLAALREDREARVKSANSNLSDDFFTQERIDRWANMTDDAFGEVVAAFETAAQAAPKTKEQAAAATTTQTAAFTGGQEVAAATTTSTTRQFLMARHAAPTA